MNLRLDLLLAPERCSRCTTLCDRLVATRDDDTGVLCLDCAHHMLAALGWQTWEPTHEHATPAVALPPEHIGRILKRTSVHLLLAAHHAHVEHAYAALRQDTSATVAPEPTGPSVRATT